MRFTFLGIVLMAGQALAAAAGGPLELKGKLDAVTVYRGQALVTRVVDVPPPAGLREIIVTDLPSWVVPGSLYAESANGVEVRSVLYRERAVPQDVREEVRKLDAQIRDIQDKMLASQRNRQVLTDHRAYLAKMEQFTAGTATAEMTKGVLNADTITKITAFLLEQHRTLAAEDLKLTREDRDLREQLALVQRQREELAGGSARTVREAVLFVNLAAAGGKVRVRCLVDQAGWEPSYNMRADARRTSIAVEYNASVQQMSGEDWTDVNITLSTASPTLLAKAPVLTPLAVSLTSGQVKQEAFTSLGATYSEARRNWKTQRQIEEQVRLRAATRPAFQAGQFAANANPDITFDQQNPDNDENLNRLANELQVVELISKDTKAKDDDTARVGEGISVDYELPSRLSLPSRSDRQLVQIALLPMKATFYKIGIPVLTNYVYDEAAITNDGKLVLLAGPVMSYISGQFVGRSQIPTVAVGESFTVGFGIDSSLRVNRELLEKTEAVQGGNRVLNFTYRLSLENFGTMPAAVRLLDRLPTAKEQEIKVTLAPGAPELSKDPAYQPKDRKKGILRWDVEVPAQAIGPKAFTLDYQFKAEYDKQMSILGMPMPAKR